MSSSLYLTVTGKQGFGYDDLNLLLKTFPIDKPVTCGLDYKRLSGRPFL